MKSEEQKGVFELKRDYEMVKYLIGNALVLSARGIWGEAIENLAVAVSRLTEIVEEQAEDVWHEV